MSWEGADQVRDEGPTPEDHGDAVCAQELLRVMVVDDHDLFRSGLRRLLDGEAGLEVVAAARGGEEAVRLAGELRPDVILMDVNMPGVSGIAATGAILKASPEIAVLMLTVSVQEDEVLDAVLAGASGYLLKDATLAEIVTAARAAAAGQSMIAPRVAGSLLARLRRHEPHEEGPGVEHDLTERELDVLTLMVAGSDNVKVAQQLHLSPSTVKHHVSSILKKLGVDNRIQAAVLAVRQGLVRDPS